MIKLLLCLIWLTGIFNLGVILILALYFQNKLQEIRNVMNEQEQALDTGIQTLKDAIATANQRVIDKIKEVSANNPDLTDELAEVTALTESVNDILKADAPPPAEPPTEEPPTPVDETPAETPGEAPVDPAPPTEGEPENPGGGL